jgi:hypothetical protein
MQIKSEQHGFRLGLAAVAQPVEYGNAILAADHHLAIDQAGAAGERGDGGSYGRIAVGPIDPAAGQEPHTSGITARQQSGSRESIPPPLGALAPGLVDRVR